MKRCFLLLLPLLLLFSLAAVGCSQQNATLEYLLTDEPVTLDPQIAADDNAKVAITALFEGLTRLDEANNPIPGVATDWEVSVDGLTYTFHLRSDAQWSDGQPVTAGDFVYAFQRALDPATQSTTCSTLFCIQNAVAVHNGTLPVSDLGISAPNDLTVVIQLSYPNHDLPKITASAPCMPCRKDFFVSTAGKYGLEAKQILGNGPFVMENTYSWEHGSYLNLIRSTTYHGAEEVLPARLTLTIADEDTDSNTLHLLTQKTTCAAKISIDDLEALAKTKCKSVSFTDTTWGICFQTKTSSLSNAAIRSLFLQAIDRQALLFVLPANTETADGILPPATLWNGTRYQSGTNLTNLQTQNTTAAAKEVPTITILCPNTTTGKNLANALITMWNSAFHQYYNMEPVSQTELEERIANGTYEVAITYLRANGEGPYALLDQFLSNSSKNPAGWSNDTYDRLLEVNEQISAETMLQNFRQAEQLLIDEAVFYPIYYESTTYAEEEGLTGTIFYPYGLGIDFRQTRKG